MGLSRFPHARGRAHVPPTQRPGIADFAAVVGGPRRDALRPDSCGGPGGHALHRRSQRHAVHRPTRRRRDAAAPSSAGHSRLRDPGGAGARRHGRGVPGPPDRLQPHRRTEDDPVRGPRRRRRARPLPHRGGGRRPLAAPQHRAGPRGRRTRGTALLLDGVLPRRRPGAEAARHAAAAGGGGPTDRDAGAGGAGGAQAERDSPAT